MLNRPLSLINRLKSNRIYSLFTTFGCYVTEALFSEYLGPMCEKQPLHLYMFYGDRLILQPYCIDKAESEGIAQGLQL